MSEALALDLWQRVVGAVRNQGVSRRAAAAARFNVSAASISLWCALERRSGDRRPSPLGGDRRSGAIGAHADMILTVFEARNDMTIEELRTEIVDRGVRFGYGTLWRFFARHRLTRKKNSARCGQDRPDALIQHWAWFDGQIDFDPDRLVFVDESWGGCCAGLVETSLVGDQEGPVSISVCGAFIILPALGNFL